MKLYQWDPEKNEWLKANRGLCFEDVVFCLEDGRVLERADHPNQIKYPGQKIVVVEIDEYACLVPFVETEDTIFLKTIIPSRKATKKYLKKGPENEPH